MMSKMKKAKTLAALKERSRDINAQIDAIVLSGGIVGLGDPLVLRLREVNAQIRKLNNLR
jgi:hypothetical protein